MTKIFPLSAMDTRYDIQYGVVATAYGCRVDG